MKNRCRQRFGNYGIIQWKRCKAVTIEGTDYCAEHQPPTPPDNQLEDGELAALAWFILDDEEHNYYDYL